MDTEEEFWQALNSGKPVEVTRELGDLLGIAEGDGGHTPSTLSYSRTSFARKR